MMFCTESDQVPPWYGNTPADRGESSQPAAGLESPSDQANETGESGQTTPLPDKASLPLTADEQSELDQTVQPYLDELVYYEMLKSTKSTKAKPSPKGSQEDAEVSSADDVAPVEVTVESDSPNPTSAPSTSQQMEESPVGKYPYNEFTSTENFEAYLTGAPEMSLKTLLHRTSIIQQVLQAYQNEWVEVDKQIYEWEEADKSKSKLLAEEQKIQADIDQAEDDAKMLELSKEYKAYLSLSRREWNESFTKQYEEEYSDMDEAGEAKARATLVLLNRLRDPFYMKGFHRRQKATQSQKWDDKLVEKPEAESKQTKEEKDLDERKRKFLTDRITFDDMLRADAYGYTYNALDLSRGDQRLPNLRVVPKSKATKRNGLDADIDIDLEAPRPKRARKGIVTESGDNSEAASATEEETPLPEKRRGRGQNIKLSEVNASLIASAEASNKGATTTDDTGPQRKANGQKTTSRSRSAAGGPAKGRTRAPAKSKLAQMSRAASESEDDLSNDFKRKADDDGGLEPPAAKRAKAPLVGNISPAPFQGMPWYNEYSANAPGPNGYNSIASLLNPTEQPYGSSYGQPSSDTYVPWMPSNSRKQPMPTPSSSAIPSMSALTGNPDTAENSENDANGKNKKSRLKTELERKVQSDAMKENWKDPTGKMRMGIERRNRRAGRKKFEQTRLTNGGEPNPHVIYKSDDENFSYAYFNETPPAPTPPAPSLTPNPPPVGYAIAQPQPITAIAPSYAPLPPQSHSQQSQPQLYDEPPQYAPPPAQERPPPPLAAPFNPTPFSNPTPPKRPRAKRPRPIKTNSNGSSGRSRPSSQTKQVKVEDSSSESSDDGPSLYEQFQQIASPTGGIDLGKRKSIQRQPLPAYGTTSEEDGAEGSDFH